MKEFVSIEDVTQMLDQSQFKRVEMPFSLAGISFNFSAAFVGQPPSNDLILIIDTDRESELRLTKRVQGLARALDLIESRKPITAVILGKKIDRDFVESLSYLCRVITLRDASISEVSDRLAIFRPLELPQPNDLVAEPYDELLSVLEHFDGPLKTLAEEGLQDSASVRERLITLINSQLIDEEGSNEWYS